MFNISSHKMLVGTAVQTYQFTLLSLKDSDNHLDHHEKLYIIIHTRKVAVLLELNLLGVKITAIAYHSHKTLVRTAVLAY